MACVSSAVSAVDVVDSGGTAVGRTFLNQSAKVAGVFAARVVMLRFQLPSTWFHSWSSDAATSPCTWAPVCQAATWANEVESPFGNTQRWSPRR